MGRYSVTLRGSGRVEIAAYGTGDAEATVEKELLRALPGAILQIAALRRVDPEARIVEAYELDLRVRVTLPVQAEEPEAAAREALRAARAALDGTRFARFAWDAPVTIVPAGTGSD